MATIKRLIEAINSGVEGHRALLAEHMALTALLIDKGIITREELDTALGMIQSHFDQLSAKERDGTLTDDDFPGDLDPSDQQPP